MSKSTAKSTATATATATAKKGQAVKSLAPAPVQAIRPTAPVGYTVLAAPLSAAKAGAKPSEYYPQGDVAITLIAKGSSMGADQQRNWDAIHAALGGTTGKLSSALAKDNKAACTRRHVRRLARAGYLSWK